MKTFKTFLFLLFCVVSLINAHKGAKHCGLGVHKYIRYCMPEVASSELCTNLLSEIDESCLSMLTDARYCYRSLQNVCGLSVRPWKNGEVVDDEKTEEIFLKGTVHCIMDRFPMFDAFCQGTATMQMLKARSDMKRCVMDSGHYLRECSSNAFGTDSLPCQMLMSRIKTMGCESVLADMQICQKDVEEFCPLPSITSVALPPIPLAMQPPMTSFPTTIGSTINNLIAQMPPQPAVPGNRRDADVPSAGAVDSFNNNVNSVTSTQPVSVPQQVGAGSQTTPPNPTANGILVGGAPLQTQPQIPTEQAGVAISVQIMGPNMPFPGDSNNNNNNHPSTMPMPLLPPMDRMFPQPKLVHKVMKRCLAIHLDDFSPECQNTNLMQHFRKHMEEKDEFEGGFHHRWGKHFCHRLHRHLGTRVCVWLAVGLVTAVICLIWIFRERSRRAALRRERQANMPAKTATWSTGLFGSWSSCLPDWKTCLPSFLCPQLQTAFNQAEVNERDLCVADVCMNVYKPMMIDNVYRDRQAIRTKYDMESAPCQDMLASILCTPCAIAQNARELDARANVGQGNTPLAYQLQVDEKTVQTGVPLKEIMKL